MEYSKSQRGNLVLLYQGYEYLKFRENTTTGETIWRCRKFHSGSNKCRSSLKTIGEDIVSQPATHSHEACPQKAKANIAVSQMKEEMKTVGATAKIVIGNVLSNLSSDVLRHIPKRSSLSRSLYKQKSDNTPNPDSPNFAFPDKYSHLILYDSGEHDPDRIIAVGDMELMQQLDTDTIYGDGTFDEVPSMFYQLFTWHASVGSAYPPCLYFLLQRKDLETYNKMFAVLKDMLPNLSPKNVLLDFDKACVKAVHIAFPNAEIQGCYFHLCQSLVSKIQSVGLKTEYEGNIEIKLMLKSLAALTFVPSNDVRDVFDTLASSFPDEEMFNDVLAFFLASYIGSVIGRNPHFPMRMWNHFEAVTEKSPKTTNCLQGFHNALNSNFHCSNPTMWHLMDGLQRDIGYHRHTLDSLAESQDGQPEVKKTRLDRLHDQVIELVQGYHADQDQLNYLKKMVSLQ